MSAVMEYKSPQIKKLRQFCVERLTQEQVFTVLDRLESLVFDLDNPNANPLLFGEPLIDRSSSQSEDAALESVKQEVLSLVEDLSDDADLSVSQRPEEFLSIDEVSQMYHVSSKTVSRWRKQGLPSRRILFGKRKRVAISRKALERFAQKTGKQEHSSVQSIVALSEPQRDEIIRRARKAAAGGASLSQTAEQIGELLGYPPEAIKNVIRQYDKQNPQDVIFPDSSTPLTPYAQDCIYQAYCRGETVEQIAPKYGRSVPVMQRILTTIRTEKIQQLPLDYIASEEFETAGPETYESWLGPIPSPEKKMRGTRMPPDLPPYLRNLYIIPLLTPLQERHLFRKMNFQKFMASRIRDTLDVSHPQQRALNQIEQYWNDSIATKNEITAANLRLVVSIAKKHIGPQDNLFDLVSDGNVSLIRAVEKFDYTRGNKFSTYASWAIIKNFARTIPTEHKQRERYPSTEDEYFNSTFEETPIDPDVRDKIFSLRENQVKLLFKALDPREQLILSHRFGLVRDRGALTLKQIGIELGVTKERVRQIETRALEKLKKLVETSPEVVILPKRFSIETA
ncbi:MAG: sigma-70 family RNA polymerase sigma factor [Thermoguttaceae bacterium]|nr:sigma-70 family RNA polymerase sigma factor [Thermoguttaceae bacterium]